MKIFDCGTSTLFEIISQYFSKAGDRIYEKYKK